MEAYQGQPRAWTIYDSLTLFSDGWKLAGVYRLSQFSLALHSAAGLLGAMLEEGIPRDDIEAALSRALDDIEQQIEEDKTMGGPPMGSA